MVSDFKERNYSLSATQYLSELSHNRLIVIGSLFSIAFIIIIFRLFVLVLVTDPDEAIKFIQNSAPYLHRKEIIDRNGEILAVNLSTASLYAKPKQIFEPEEVAKKLVNIFPDLKYKDLLSNFKGNKRFVWIKRNITPSEQYAVNNLGVPGLNFEKGEKRIYLQGNIFSHVLGYVDVDGHGISGVEKYFDKDLTSESTKLKINEKQFQLSLDVRIQNIVYDVLKQSVNQYNADGAAAIVMDVNNGEIYSMVSLPDFDPHQPSKSSKESLFNKATLGVFELGSVFKVLTFAMALDAKTTNLNDVYFVKNKIKAGKFKIGDYKKKTDWLSVPEIFMYSSNIGTARISLELGKEAQKKYLEKFKLTTKTNIELPEKGIPILPSQSSWNEINTMTISYGHGIAITPLHMIQAFGAVVNGGYLYPATLVKNKNDDHTMIEQIISSQASHKMRRLLRLVVENGTGKGSDVPGYFVGGKTGSADKSIKGGYSTNSKISTYVCSFPMHNPKYALIIMLDAPKAKANYLTTAGRAVAPMAKEIIQRIAPILKVTPIDENNAEVQNQLSIEYKTESEILDSL